VLRNRLPPNTLYNVQHTSVGQTLAKSNSAAISPRERFIVDFDSCFSEESIIRQLCRDRAKRAKVRNDELFLDRIAFKRRAKGNPKSAQGSWDIFPPRRSWHRYRPRRSERGTKSAFDLNLETIFRAVIDLRKRTPNEGWVLRLKAKVDELRSRVLQERAFTFRRPRVIPIEKDRNAHKYRPLALFSREDRIIDSLAAKYFRQLLDRVLLPCCLAFRSGTTRRQPPTIHDALEAILDINQRNQPSGLYVAECDIRAFFDSVSHETARTALDVAIKEATAAVPAISVDPRAMAVFEAYLNAYCFEEDALGRGCVELHKQDPKGQFSWPSDALRVLHGREKLPRIGIPQGGAISCLIANLVLHAADKRVRQTCQGTTADFIYMRYCDDMIILAADRTQCESAYRGYFDTLLKLRLPTHPAKMVEEYSSKFFEGKSNAPYHWGTKSGGSVPWIQFVGYQVRHDGLVRARKKSLRKHFEKLTSSANELLKALNVFGADTSRVEARKTKRQVIHRLRQRLISLSVGRIRLGLSATSPMPMCWSNGFKGLLGKKIVAAHLKALDGHRERQVRRVARRIATLQVTNDGSSPPRQILPFYGCPFSYWAQFQPVQTTHFASCLAASCSQCRRESMIVAD